MSTTLVIVAAVIVVLFLGWILKRRAASGVSLNTYVSAVTEAADAGERAYRAQVETLSKRTGQSVNAVPRGVALARLLCALFPTAAFVALDASDAVIPSVKRHAPFAGKGAWDLASGAALMPLDLADKPYFPQIKSDTNRVTQAYVDFFNDHFSSDPTANIAAAEMYLAPYWQEALELSLGQMDPSHYTTQFCTSGLHVFVEWLQALSKPA